MFFGYMMRFGAEDLSFLLKEESAEKAQRQTG